MHFGSRLSFRVVNFNVNHFRHDFRPTQKVVYGFSGVFHRSFTCFYHVIDFDSEILDNNGSGPLVKIGAIMETGGTQSKNAFGSNPETTYQKGH